MGCSGCGTSSCSPKGCGSNGHCASGGCNRLNTYDWLTSLEIADVDAFDVVEISFKNGARKGFFRDDRGVDPGPGDMVVVDIGQGFDIGSVGLKGELARLQLKKKRVKEDHVVHSIVRLANERDLEKLREARDLEMPAMVRARAIARNMGLDMKVGDVEYQGDLRKATFFYTADGRVDFRELVREYAREFRVKIEMRQIGARQESARIGGIGSCGRELCCSTWLTDFKSVTTSAARYQNLSINQSKLSGQCGRLKCCLNYELDTYMEAMEDFPEQADYIQGLNGRASLIKIDIFKGLMFYSVEVERGRPRVIALAKEQVKEAILANKKGQKLDLLTLHAVQEYVEVDEEDRDYEYADGTGEIELPSETTKKRNRGRRKPGKSGKGPQSSRGKKQSGPPRTDQNKNQSGPPRTDQNKNQSGGKKDSNRTSDNRNKNRK